MNVLLVFDELVTQQLLEVATNFLQSWNAIDDISCEMETIEIVKHRHVKRRGGGALFFVAAHMHIVVITPAIGEPMNQPWITVIGEDHRLVDGEQRVEVDIGEAMRMLACRLNRHQTDNIHNA